VKQDANSTLAPIGDVGYFLDAEFLEIAKRHDLALRGRKLRDLRAHHLSLFANDRLRGG
jgi:hypothetical protein